MELLTAEITLCDHLREREKNILKILAMPANKYKMEDYHRLRVEIKKLKTLLELVNYCNKDFQKKKYFKPFIKIFKQSGKIRKLQQEESILEMYDVSKIEKYLIRVKVDIKKNKKEFQFLIEKKHKIKIKKTFKKVAPYLKELPSHKINDFIKKFTAIRTFFKRVGLTQ
ncbi:MAG TPA: hypothetical protein VFI29_05795 [Hanamia sp.]|nr:hypothetical protein [Hanamia sp.]